MIKEEVDKHINKISDSPSLFKIWKIARCITAFLLWKVLSIWEEKKYPKVVAKYKYNECT